MRDNSMACSAVSKIVVGISMTALTVGSLATGCGVRSVPTEVRGMVEFQGKPVFPAVIMLKDSRGNGLTDNLDGNGEFRVFGVSATKYSVVIEPIQLDGLSKIPQIPPAGKKGADGAEEPLRREDTVPDKFKNANIDIPKKYLSFETSGLEIDCSNGIPAEPVKLKLD